MLHARHTFARILNGQARQHPPAQVRLPKPFVREMPRQCWELSWYTRSEALSMSFSILAVLGGQVYLDTSQASNTKIKISP